MRDLVHVDLALLELAVLTEFDYMPGTTWRTCKDRQAHLGWPGHHTARITYQPIDPWNLTKRLARPYHVFINGTAQMSYVSLAAAESHLIARGFNPLGDPTPLYPVRRMSLQPPSRRVYAQT